MGLPLNVCFLKYLCFARSVVTIAVYPDLILNFIGNPVLV